MSSNPSNSQERNLLLGKITEHLDTLMEVSADKSPSQSLIWVQESIFRIISNPPSDGNMVSLELTERLLRNNLHLLASIIMPHPYYSTILKLIKLSGDFPINERQELIKLSVDDFLDVLSLWLHLHGDVHAHILLWFKSLKSVKMEMGAWFSGKQGVSAQIGETYSRYRRTNFWLDSMSRGSSRKSMTTVWMLDNLSTEIFTITAKNKTMPILPITWWFANQS